MREVEFITCKVSSIGISAALLAQCLDWKSMDRKIKSHKVQNLSSTHLCLPICDRIKRYKSLVSNIQIWFYVMMHYSFNPN